MSTEHEQTYTLDGLMGVVVEAMDAAWESGRNFAMRGRSLDIDQKRKDARTYAERLLAQSAAKPEALTLSDERILEIAHRKASTYKHRTDAETTSYGFVKHTLLAFARAILAGGAAVQPTPPEEMSPEFTDTSRAALCWVLWHHQGFDSDIGMAMRFALGMGRDDELSDYQVREAQRWAALDVAAEIAAITAPSQPTVQVQAIPQPSRLIPDYSELLYCIRVAAGDPKGKRWQPIESAPFDIDPATECRWLSECMLLVNGVAVQGMCSGGEWLRRDEEDAASSRSWDLLGVVPTHWKPLPAPPQPQGAERASIPQTDAGELSGCPFCGGSVCVFASSDHPTAWEGGCGNEACSVQPSVWGRSKAEAIEALNRRASIPLGAPVLSEKSGNADAVANFVCGALPEGWEIRLCMELGAGWVTLCNDEGDIIPFDADDKTIDEQIDAAIDTALSSAKEREPTQQCKSRRTCLKQHGTCAMMPDGQGNPAKGTCPECGAPEAALSQVEGKAS